MATGRTCCSFELATGTYLVLILEILLVLNFLISESNKIITDKWDDMLTVYGYICLGTALLGLVGSSQKRLTFLIPFLSTSVITLVITLVVGILWPSRLYWSKWGNDLPYPLPLIAMLIRVVLTVSSFIVVLCYAWQLKEEEEAKKNASQNTTSVAQS